MEQQNPPFRTVILTHHHAGCVILTESMVATRNPVVVVTPSGTSKLSQTRLSDRPGEVAHAFSVLCRAFEPDISESIVNLSEPVSRTVY